MKRIVLLVICFMLTGCTVHREVIKSGNSYKYQKINLKIALLDNVSTNVEQAAAEYEKANPNVSFEFLRYKNDESYRTNLINDIRDGKLSAFSVRGEKDITFFKKYLYDFDIKDLGDDLVLIDDMPVFRINQYSSCLWYNKDMLNAMQIDPHELTTISGLENAIVKMNELASKFGVENVVSQGYDLSSLICTANFENGKVDQSLEKLLSLIGQGEFENPNQLIYNRKSVLYFGSERLLNSQLESDYSNIIDHVFIPYAGHSYNISESDYVCISANATESQKVVLKDFLKMLSDIAFIKSSKIKYATNSKVGLTPPGFGKYLNERVEKLRKKKISWEEFENDLMSAWNRYSSFDSGL
ncbi:MAG: hypothetical protein K2I60_03340 [Oscillospiraceae bacterium]|nr:hypothetical protein [Oscillospiraceae bacterium]